MNRILSFFCLPLLLFGGSLNTHIMFNGEPMVSLRTITQAFHGIGYKLEIDSLTVQNHTGELSAAAVGNKPFNGVALDENLKDEGIRVEKAYFDKGELFLELDTQSSFWNLPLLEGDDGAELKRVGTAQWFRVENVQHIRIQPPYTGKWYPDVAIYDRSLRLLSSFRSQESKEELQFEFPQDAYYLKVSNVQGMKVLKEGMWIESMSTGQ